MAERTSWQIDQNFLWRDDFLNQDFNSPSNTFLLFNHLAFTKNYKGVEIAKRNQWLKLNNFGFKFQQLHLVWNHQASAYCGGFMSSFAVNVFGS